MYHLLIHLARSYYVTTRRLTPQYYQDIANRGWRRSGTTLYKPDLGLSCCPHYTIRLDSTAFKVSAHQRKDVNRFNSYILGSTYIDEAARLQPPSKAEVKQRKQEFDLVSRIHESEYNTTAVAKSPLKPEHRFEVTLEEDIFTEEKYALYAKYQTEIHHEPASRVTRRGFKHHLCNSPLVRFVHNNKRLGSYHHCYRIDGDLVAMAVLDLLPDSVSAVYFMYNPDAFNKFSPGKLSALRETALCVEEDYRWYMMGYYIHSCIKMKYKADFKPQYVLDPVSYEWDVLDEEMKRKMGERQYVSLAMDRLGTPPVLKQNLQGRSASAQSKYRMPGTPQMPLTVDYMQAVKNIKFPVNGVSNPVGNYRFWDIEDENKSHSLKGLIIDMAAALGPDNLEDMAIYFEFLERGAAVDGMTEDEEDEEDEETEDD